MHHRSRTNSVGLRSWLRVSDHRGVFVEFFLTHPVFVALDLASDKAHGVEILSSWNPKGFTRVS